MCECRVRWVASRAWQCGAAGVAALRYYGALACLFVFRAPTRPNEGGGGSREGGRGDKDTTFHMYSQSYFLSRFDVTYFDGEPPTSRELLTLFQTVLRTPMLRSNGLRLQFGAPIHPPVTLAGADVMGGVSGEGRGRGVGVRALGVDVGAVYT